MLLKTLAESVFRLDSLRRPLSSKYIIKYHVHLNCIHNLFTYFWHNLSFLFISYEKTLPLVCDDLEKTWLFHEIGSCYLQLERHEEARDYGVRSVAAADGIADNNWQMNANVLLAQSECKYLFRWYHLILA